MSRGKNSTWSRILRAYGPRLILLACGAVLAPWAVAQNIMQSKLVEAGLSTVNISTEELSNVYLLPQ